jgi:hypothetical protein
MGKSKRIEEISIVGRRYFRFWLRVIAMVELTSDLSETVLVRLTNYWFLSIVY